MNKIKLKIKILNKIKINIMNNISYKIKLNKQLMIILKIRFVINKFKINMNKMKII